MASAYEVAEEKRMAKHRARSARLLGWLAGVRARYDGVPLRIEVDNDCWHVAPTRGCDWTDEMEESLRRPKDLDVGPAELAILLAIGLGFDAGRP